MKLLYINANGTNGEQPEQMQAIYQIAGRLVAVPSNLSEAEVKAEVARRFGLTNQQVERLDQVETRFDTINLDVVDQLSDNASPAQVVVALKEMRQLIGEMRAMLRFQLMDEPLQLPRVDQA